MKYATPILLSAAGVFVAFAVLTVLGDVQATQRISQFFTKTL